MTALRKLAPYWPEGIIGILVVLAFIPVFAKPGFLFFLDWDWAPSIAPLRIDNVHLLSGLPIQMLAHTLATIFSSEITQKLLLFITLATMGMGMIALTKRSILPYAPKRIIEIAALGSGIFFTFNSFVLNRISLGHIYFLFGYALTPWALLFFLKALDNPRKKTALIAGLFAAFTMSLSIHHIVLLPIPLLAIALANKKNNKAVLRNSGFFLVPIIAFLIAQASAGLYSTDWVGYDIMRKSQEDYKLQYPCTNNAIIDTTTLSSTWRPVPKLCPSNLSFFLFWPVLIALMAYGTINKWGIILAGITALLLISTNALMRHFPPWSAMRDSGKFISLLALAESVLMSAGIARIYRKMPLHIIPIAILFIVSMTSLPIFFAFSKTIIPRQYPQSWIDFAKKTEESSTPPKVLFLPQTTYATLEFTGNTPTANPAPRFFINAQIISGQEKEMQLNAETLTEEQIDYIALIPNDPRAKALESVLSTIPHLEKISEDTDLSVWQFVP